MKMHKNRRTLKRRLLTSVGVIAVAGLLAGCVGEADTAEVPSGESPSVLPASLNEVVEGAAKEGKVRLFVGNDSRTAAQAKQLEDQLYKDTGVKLKIEFVSGDRSPSATMARITTELASGIAPTFDVLVTDSKFLKALEDDNLLMDVDWSELEGISADDVWGNGLYVYEFARTVIMNTDLVSMDEAPKTMEDLLDPKWAGKVLTVDRADVFASLAVEWSYDKTLDFVQRLLENSTLAASPIAIRTQVVSGEFPLGIGVRMGAEAIASGAPIAYAPVKAPVIPHLGSILKDVSNPYAAQLMLYWLNATEGGKKMAYDVLDWPRYTTPGTDLYDLAQSASGMMIADKDWWMNDFPSIERKLAEDMAR